MKKIILLAAMGLSGCVSVGEVVDTAADANDQAVGAAEFTICNGASVGSIRRSFNTPERIQAWKTLCMKENGFSLE